MCFLNQNKQQAFQNLFGSVSNWEDHSRLSAYSLVDNPILRQSNSFFHLFPHFVSSLKCPVAES